MYGRRPCSYYYICMTDAEIKAAYEDAVREIRARHAEEMRAILAEANESSV